MDIKNINQVSDMDKSDLREEFRTKNVKIDEINEKSKV